jgi:hypothetical protein
MNAMTTDSFETALRNAAAELGLALEIPFCLNLPCGSIHAPALLKNFAYPNGLLIVQRPDEIGELGKHLNDFGYGFACIKRDQSLEGWRALCRAWGWTGSGAAPNWLEE